MAHATRRHTALPKGLDRLPSGNIRVRIIGDDGVQITIGTFSTRAEAELALARAKTEQADGRWIDPAKGRITFAEVAEQVRQYRQHDLAPRTQRENTYLLKMLLPIFGHRPVNKISAGAVAAWWGQHGDKPVARRNAYGRLSNVLSFAVEWGYIAKSPCTVRGAFADVSMERPVHTVAEFEAVVDNLAADLQRAMRVMFAAHLRVGELCGLNWSDWNPKTNTLRIERQADRNRTQETVPTKTRHTKTITLLSWGVEALHEQQQALSGIGGAPIFHGRSGGRLRAAYVGQQWRAACRQAGVENFHPHDVRHVSLTLLGKASLATLMRRGRHSTARAALRYQAAADEADFAAARAGDELLKKIQKVDNL